MVAIDRRQIANGPIGTFASPLGFEATDIMQQSNGRILTTHTGSLPRPPALTRLYAMHSRGEAVDAGEIARAGHAALQEIVPKQIEAGIDIGNNG